MSPHELEKIIEAIEQTTKKSIENTVNGKIRKMDEKFESFYKENAQFVEDSIAWRKTLQPVVNAYSTAENAGMFVKWLGGIAVAVGALVGIKHFW